MRAMLGGPGDAGAPNGRAVWVVLGCVGLVILAGQVLAVSIGEGVDLTGIGILSFPIVGALIASRQSDNAIGWIMLGIGLIAGFSTALAIYAHYALTGSPGVLPGAGSPSPWTNICGFLPLGCRAPS